VGLEGKPCKVVLAGELLQQRGLYGQYVAQAIQTEVRGLDRWCFMLNEFLPGGGGLLFLFYTFCPPHG
jgi:hypothetical protein